MTRRERSMLFAFLGIAIAFAAVVGLSSYRKYHAELLRIREAQKIAANIAKGNVALYDELRPDREWLELNEPEKKEYSQAVNELQKFVSGSSEGLGFDVFGLQLQNIEPEGGYYRRAQVTASAKATNEKIVEWLCRLHSPKNFRGVSFIKLTDSAEDGLVLCQAVVEQWIVEDKSIPPVIDEE